MTLRSIGESTLMNGQDARRAVGTMADDRTQLVNATLVKKGRQMWRVVLVGTSGTEPAVPDAPKLQELLFASIE